ncbi:MAG: GAF and ANTAR domain-containing protein [Actinomycetota bacterium]|nr:GAF and ANTAR domain-containing protein [Actinomycetota bacterium]
MRVLGLLVTGGAPGGRRLCEVAAQVTEMSGAGVMLLSEDRPQASLCSTDTVSAAIEEAQYTLGEGPCVDAHRQGTPIIEADLAAAGPSRWAAFSTCALDAGARAVFGFPVRIGTVRLGALNLYRDRPGALGDDQQADALVMADVAASAILAAQSDGYPGELGVDLEADTHVWTVVHQAAGMVSIQLDIPVGDALVRLRAHAFRTGRPASEVARDIVERRLHFDPGT